MLSDAYYPAYKLMADNGYKIDWNNYFPGIRAYYASSKGEMFSFPFNSSTALLYWNKDAFQKIGKTEAPKTWEEAAADMKALKAAGYDCPLAFDISQDESWQLMEQFSAVHGEPIATKNNGFGGLDAELTFNKTKFVQVRHRPEELVRPGPRQDQVAEHRRGLRRRLRRRPLPDDADLGRRPRQHRPHRRPEHALGRRPAAGLCRAPTRHNSFVGGASLWVLKGHTPEEYKAAAAFLNFIAQPEQALFWSTVTGYIPVTKTGFDYMKAQRLLRQAALQGPRDRHRQPVELRRSNGPGGIRLGNFLQIRGELAQRPAGDLRQQGRRCSRRSTRRSTRGNAILRRFEATYKGKQLP